MTADMHLALFFTGGVSLRTWVEGGMFEREVAVYRRLQEHGIRISFITYGKADDLRYKKSIPGIDVLCNRWGLPGRVYSWTLPILHFSTFAPATVFKTNQVGGSDVALRAARLWRKPLVARCGYLWSQVAARERGPQTPETRRALGVEANVFTAAQRVVVTTPAMQRDVARRVPAAVDRMVVIPNYVDTGLFHPANGKRGDDQVIFVGRLSREKNL
ncbi:MAG: glycosyltransferase, partial [Dehalococcoidia bacterium]